MSYKKTKKIPFVIFAAGKGTRLIPEARKKPKTLLKIGKKLLIEYVLDTAKIMGAEEIFIVVGYKGNMIKRKVGKNYQGIPIEYIFLKEIKGTADNFPVIRPSIRSSFALLLGDEVYLNANHKEIVPFYSKEKPDGICGITAGASPKLIKKGYSVKLSGKFISEVVEKPEKIINGLRGWGTYIFNKSVFNFVEKTPINPKTGKRELTDLIQVMIKAGKKFLPFNLKGLLVNVNTKEDLIEAKRIVKRLKA